jgi:hypothetical protein
MAWFRKTYVDEYVLDYNGEYAAGSPQAEAEAAARDVASPDLDDGVPGSARGCRPSRTADKTACSIRAIRRLNYSRPNKRGANKTWRKCASTRRRCAMPTRTTDARRPTSTQRSTRKAISEFRLNTRTSIPERALMSDWFLASAAAATVVAGAAGGRRRHCNCRREHERGLKPRPTDREFDFMVLSILPSQDDETSGTRPIHVLRSKLL